MRVRTPDAWRSWERPPKIAIIQAGPTTPTLEGTLRGEEDEEAFLPEDDGSTRAPFQAELTRAESETEFRTGNPVRFTVRQLLLAAAPPRNDGAKVWSVDIDSV